MSKLIVIMNTVFVRIDGLLQNIIEFSYINALFFILYLSTMNTNVNISELNTLLLFYKNISLAFIASLLYIPVYAINDIINYYDDLHKSIINRDYGYRITVFYKKRYLPMLHIVFVLSILMYMCWNLQLYVISLFILSCYIVSIIHSVISEKVRPLTTFLLIRSMKYIYCVILYAISTFNIIENGDAKLYMIMYIIVFFYVFPYILYYALFMHKGRKIYRWSKAQRLVVVISPSILGLALMNIISFEHTHIVNVLTIFRYLVIPHLLLSLPLFIATFIASTIIYRNKKGLRYYLRRLLCVLAFWFIWLLLLYHAMQYA